MPSYVVTAPDGRKVKLTGDSPPTDDDLDEIFKGLPPMKAPPAPETPFPTPMETAGRTAMGAAKAIPGMAMGMMAGATAPFMQVPNEVLAYFAGKPSPTMQLPGQLASMAKQVGQGVDEITTPLQKTIIGGAGAVSPQEMNTAADTGGAAIANIAAPELARGGVAVAGRMPGVGKLLKFAPAITTAAMGHPVIAAKMAVRTAIKAGVMDALGTIAKDGVINAIKAGDVEGASAAMAKGLDKSPKAADAFATAMESAANQAAGMTPEMEALLKTATDPSASSKVALKARADLKAAGWTPDMGLIARPIPESAVQRPGFVDEAQGQQAYDRSPTGYGRGSTVNPGPWEAVDPLPETPKPPPSKAWPEPEALGTVAKREKVGGLEVHSDVPNTDSIASTFNEDEYTTLPGIRKVPLNLFDSAPHDLFYASNDIARVKRLAAEIKENGYIKPLVVAYDAKGPYILEGAHRLGALHELGVKEFPAMVVDARPPAPIKTPQMPVPGNVKPATVYTKPGPKVKPPAGETPSAKALAEKQKTVAPPDAIRAAFGESPKGGTPHGTKGPSGRPLTASERLEALKELQRAIAADQDIFQAFGLE